MKGDFSLSEQRDLITISRLRMLTGLAVCNIMSSGNVCISSVLIFADPLAISPLTFLSKRARFTYQFSGIILMRMFTEDSNNYDGLCMETRTVCWIGQLKYKNRRKKSKCIAPPLKWRCIIQDKNKCNSLTLNLAFGSCYNRLTVSKSDKCNESVILQTWHQLWSSVRFSILYWLDNPNRVDILYSPPGIVHCRFMGWSLEIVATTQSLSDLGEVYLKQA